ncbi:CaiB/BaiF CoA transferase family protein [Kitasatospora sp. NPDC052896]|uniref:CaiB/BaiF CoA transferase family protein n=1 Tax=Kitasatospora sp. NPDC052896 TaxID=3364061 RepID=UPI0037C681D9
MTEQPCAPSGRGLLAGVRVVELASVIMAPYAAQQLGDLGADVIKVEPPAGDMTRHYPPRRHPGMGGAALNLNRNKRSAVIDLKAPHGRDALLALLRTSDVFITNLRPQALARLRLDHRSVAAANPGLIYANAQGFRGDSGYGTHAAYDDIIQAASGLVWLNHQVSGQPHYVPTLLADKICGMQIAQSVLAALHYREHGGTGQHIEVPMVDTMLAFNLVEHLGAAALEPDGAFGSTRSLSPERRAQRTADGWMCILPQSDRNWRDFTAFVHRPELADDPRFATGPDRAHNADQLYRLMAEVTPRHTSAQWQEFCDRVGIAAAPVLDLESAATTAYAREGGLLHEADHPTEGRYRVIGRPVRYSADPNPQLRPCPAIGQHTDEVLRECGFDPALLHPAG